MTKRSRLAKNTGHPTDGVSDSTAPVGHMAAVHGANGPGDSMTDNETPPNAQTDEAIRAQRKVVYRKLVDARNNARSRKAALGQANKDFYWAEQDRIRILRDYRCLTTTAERIAATLAGGKVCQCGYIISRDGEVYWEAKEDDTEVICRSCYVDRPWEYRINLSHRYVRKEKSQ